MKHTNRFLALFLSLIMLLSFAGCNSDTYDYTDSSTGQPNISTEEDSTKSDTDSQIQPEQSSVVESMDKKDSSSVTEKPGATIRVGTGTANVQPGISINYATGDSSGPSSSTTTITPSIEQDNTNDNQAASGDMVWIPNSGSKYHSRSGCSNMKNPRQVTKQEAENEGYEPCKKCW